MFVQYLGPMLIFMGVTLISIRWPRFGSGLHVILALLAAWFFQAFTNAVTFLLLTPLIGIGALYWFGRPRPRKIALSLAVGLPILTLIISGIEPVLRVSQRLDDGNLQARLVHGNGVNLIWAPDGPGWPREGVNWFEAQRVCQYLGKDSLTPAPMPQHIWRLPAVDKAVRSMARHGQNSGDINSVAPDDTFPPGIDRCAREGFRELDDDDRLRRLGRLKSQRILTALRSRAKCDKIGASEKSDSRAETGCVMLPGKAK